MKPVCPGHRVLVKPTELAEVDAAFAAGKRIEGFQFIEKTERQEATIIDTGTVVQVGPTAFNDFGGADKWCKVGDVISYTRYGGKAIIDPDNKDNKWLVINDEDVIMVWEKTNG